MKDPKRIDKILKIVRKKWKENPDLRLCQLLGNCFDTLDLYFVEDEDLVRCLKETYKK
jgi:uncharacterized protein YihD (DUF1040 family)